ncbi:uncharacterized protein LOC117404297 isoform X4 [Acipenser ruthenus]|uniref:uncharacterized protein LOC117404297 isoform X4 n=1 Tax=Acipenser ruthenus TaxID=7906 RepID=UPI002740C56F|nr:uncharacterized protein LOC117404297 isoform X4 [Acipenser ruthenus]XP_058873328.1 uncharacterized protein LOC117404297 isoform X4 [Acipenser ruthenus]XP_058873329.1 uncharacterized protein LOC117404297 isoform X4 [Acipenser ruthenus]XP_058873330.1 uncharacterized protein LOC117404297 isoform X4 [Acipenser ruthenus]
MNTGDLLRKNLDNLGKENFKRFRVKLREEKGIPWNALEDADVSDTVDKMMQVFVEEAVPKAIQILESINVRDVAQEMSREWNPDCLKSDEPNLEIERLIIDDQEDVTLWTHVTLQRFETLPDFTTNQIQALQKETGECEEATPENSRSVSVRQFLDSRGRCSNLRRLCEALKRVSRQDVVDVMHSQKALLPKLGPKEKEEVKITDLKFSVWHPLTVALSVEREDGHDWRWLADKLGIPATYRDLWRQNYSNPAEKVLDSWKIKIGEATMGGLFDHMIAMGREDLADLL